MRVFKRASLPVAILAASLWAGQAAADQLPGQADDVVLGVDAAVSVDTLEDERGMANIEINLDDIAVAITNNHAENNGDQTVNADGAVSLTGGDVNLTESAVSNNRFNITTINTGANVKTTNIMSVNIIFMGGP